MLAGSKPESIVYVCIQLVGCPVTFMEDAVMATTGVSVAKKHFSAGPKKRPGRAAGRNGHNHGSTGLQIENRFCPIEVADPFDTVQWDLRTAAIKGESGEVLFEQ